MVVVEAVAISEESGDQLFSLTKPDTFLGNRSKLRKCLVVGNFDYKIKEWANESTTPNLCLIGHHTAGVDALKNVKPRLLVSVFIQHNSSDGTILDFPLS